jgi:CRP-like cAMP-binding protein
VALSGMERRNRAGDLRSEAICQRLSALVSLSETERDFLRRVGSGPMSLWAPRSFVDQPASDHPAPRYIISGWAAHARELQDGRRQFIQLLLPGDALCPLLQVRQPQTVLCLSMVQTVDGGALRLAAQDRHRFPGIAAAVEVAAAHDRALMIEQVIRLGRQTAYERMANLFVELHHRCSTVGLVHGDGFAFPLTQESLGDLLGLSVVHVNRTLQMMRNQNLIQLKQSRLTLLNLPALREAAEFKPPQATHVSP